MQESYENFIQSCCKAGGPKEPSVEACRMDTDPCNVSNNILVDMQTVSKSPGVIVWTRSVVFFLRTAYTYIILRVGV